MAHVGGTLQPVMVDRRSHTDIMPQVARECVPPGYEIKPCSAPSSRRADPPAILGVVDLPLRIMVEGSPHTATLRFTVVSQSEYSVVLPEHHLVTSFA